MTKIDGGLTTAQVLANHGSNLALLGLTYVDHLMCHYPGSWTQAPATSSPAMRQQEWLALEQIYYTGEVHAVDVDIEIKLRRFFKIVLSCLLAHA